MSTVPTCLLNTLPVLQPAHLDSDSSLTTEILPGPPSLESISQFSKRNAEPRKFAPPSYLPQTDPGTTYTNLAGGMAAMALEGTGPRRKRARLDKGISNRSQRASARHLAGSSVLNDQILVLEANTSSSHPGLDDVSAFNEDDRSTSHSRSTSAPLNGETQAQDTSRDDFRLANGKGKGKEKENAEKAAQVGVKEEPIALQLSDMTTAPVNEDHCSSCSSVGALVYCDGCPRAFHLWCLDPPMDPSDFPEGEESWFCPACKVDRVPLPRASSTFLSPLIQQLQNTIPTEFRLSEEIRNFFRDVGTGPGGVYVDNSSVKAARIGRHGVGEERDPYRLKDSKGAAVICFRCGKSPLPDEPHSESSVTRRKAATSGSRSQWKSMISCDFCPLHWHVDCLDPPMTSLPPINRKWKCPNHASGSTKLRTPRTAGPPIDITETRQRNNGNIEVIPSETQSHSEDGMSVEEVLINGRRYRVPERIIIVDFWNKIRQHKTVKTSQTLSAVSSPLTSLSSLDNSNDRPPTLALGDRLADPDTLRVAELLCQLQSTGSDRKVPDSAAEKEKREKSYDSTRSQRQSSGRKSHSFARTDPGPGEHQQSHRDESGRPPAWHDETTDRYYWKVGQLVGPLNFWRPRIEPPYPKKMRRTISNKNTSAPDQASATQRSKAAVNGVRHPSFEGPHDHSSSKATNGREESKPASSTLKIRIPGRLLQKQPSTGSASSGSSIQPEQPRPSLVPRPRRSCRQTSTYRTGSADADAMDAYEQ